MDASKDGQKLMMFASQGLINNGLKRGFRELVLRLPETSWPSADIGRQAKALSQMHSGEDLSWTGIREPNLYKGLTAVVLWDPCYLKASFWNAAHDNFGRYDNYIKMTETLAGAKRDVLPRTDPKLARDSGKVWGWDGLEDGYCEDFTPWLTDELGFEPELVHRISIFDRLASLNLTKIAFRVQKTTMDDRDQLLADVINQEIVAAKAEIDRQLSQEDRSEAGDLRRLFEEASVICLNGGNPDFLKFVLMELAAPLTKTWLHRVQQGKTIFLGRSAGSMVGGADIGLTSEPNPLLLEYLLPRAHGLHHGLQLVGSCSIRPHYSPQWDLVSALFQALRSELVVRVGNDEALLCMDGRCKMVGKLSVQGEEPLSKTQMHRLIRAFEGARAQTGFLAWLRQAPPLLLAGLGA